MARADRLLRRSLERRGAEILAPARLDRVEPGSARLSTGEEVGWDTLVLATGVRPPRLLRDSGLEVGEEAVSCAAQRRTLGTPPRGSRSSLL